MLNHGNTNLLSLLILAAWSHVRAKGNDIYKVTVKKTAVSLRIDNDVLAALKNMGKGYQTRINNILRKAVFG